jgi:hypothetical protein
VFDWDRDGNILVRATNPVRCVTPVLGFGHFVTAATFQLCAEEPLEQFAVLVGEWYQAATKLSSPCRARVRLPTRERQVIPHLWLVNGDSLLYREPDLGNDAKPDETIEVPSVGDRPPRRLARQTLAEVVEPRYEELFHLVRKELRRSGFEELIAAGIVMTGGSAKMEGAIELAEEVFHMPVRLGVPQHVDGLADVVRNPIHATGVGLLLYAREAMQAKAESAQSALGLGKVFKRMKSWFQGNL